MARDDGGMAGTIVVTLRAGRVDRRGGGAAARARPPAKRPAASSARRPRKDAIARPTRPARDASSSTASKDTLSSAIERGKDAYFQARGGETGPAGGESL